MSDLRALLTEAREWIANCLCTTTGPNDRADMLARIDEALARPKTYWRKETWGAWACLPDGTRLEAHLSTCRWEVWPVLTKYNEPTPKIYGDACDYPAAKLAAERAAGVSR